MKWYIKSNTTSAIFTIYVNIVYIGEDVKSDVNTTIVASEDIDTHVNLEPRPNVSPEQQMNELEFQEYENVINQVLDILVDSFGFHVIEQYQSSTYSYYITFKPVLADGVSGSKNYQIQFRISNHVGSGDFGQVNNILIRKQYVLDTHKYERYDIFIAKIYETCGQLMIADYSSVRDTELDEF